MIVLSDMSYSFNSILHFYYKSDEAGFYRKDLVKYNDLCHLLSLRGMREGSDYHSLDFSGEERSACIVWFSICIFYLTFLLCCGIREMFCNSS